mmetsp:Transcript_62030/g.111259  ORF Transcript_62030/g.111259 Transcript_62030/m.111259 type:complete len:279 (+) Transcript_62030:94-930(+)
MKAAGRGQRASKGASRIVTGLGSLANPGIHAVPGINSAPALCCFQRRCIFCAMSMLRRKLAAALLNELFELLLNCLCIHVFVKYQALVEDIATKMRAKTAHLNPPVRWQLQDLVEILWHGIIDDQALLAGAHRHGPNGRLHGEAKQHHAGGLKATVAHVTLCGALREASQNVLQERLQALQLSAPELSHLHDQVMVVGATQLHQLLWQRLWEDRIQVPEDLVREDVHERQGQGLKLELEVPKARKVHHSKELNHLDQNTASPVAAVELVPAHVLELFG